MSLFIEYFEQQFIQHLSGIFENNEDEPAAGQKNDGNQLKCKLQHVLGTYSRKGSYYFICTSKQSCHI